MPAPGIMTDLSQPILVGGISLPNRVLLAPLAGVTDVPFRRICQEFEAGLTSVEMLSAAAVTMKVQRTAAMCRRHVSERRLAVQVTGADGAEVARAVRVLDGMGFDLIDLNMGCPVRKIIARGWGAALLREPDRVGEMVGCARACTARPLSVKVRLGFSRATVNIDRTAASIAAAGADLLTIHGRTRCEGYATRVDLGGIREGVRAVRESQAPAMPVVGNGDVLDAASAHRMIEETGCDAVMVSRGALGNPWVFPLILGRRAGKEPTVAEWRTVVLRHLDYHQAHYGARLAPVLFRKHLLWYLSGFPGVKRMRSLCSVVDSMDRARRLMESFVAGLPDDLPRYADRRDRAAPSSGCHPPRAEMGEGKDKRIDDRGWRIEE